MNRWDTHACLSRDETLTSMANEHFGAVAVRYGLAQYGQAAIAVQGTQQWVLTRQRLVGLITLESLVDQQHLSMGVALKTVCGRDKSGIRKMWVAKGRNLYEYGALTIRLWPIGDAVSDLVTSGAIQTAYTDTFSGNTGMCGILTLVDPAATGTPQTQKTLYAAGTRFHAAVEIYPTVFGGASAVTLMQGTGGLIGLHVEEEGHTLQLLHNPAVDTVSYAVPAPGTTLHRSGEKYRANFLPAVGSINPKPAGESVAIPAGELIVLRKA